MLLNDGELLVITILIQVQFEFFGLDKKVQNLQGWPMQPVSSESVSGESVGGASPGMRNGDDGDDK